MVGRWGRSPGTSQTCLGVPTTGPPSSAEQGTHRGDRGLENITQGPRDANAQGHRPSPAVVPRREPLPFLSFRYSGSTSTTPSAREERSVRGHAGRDGRGTGGVGGDTLAGLGGTRWQGQGDMPTGSGGHAGMVKGMWQQGRGACQRGWGGACRQGGRGHAGRVRKGHASRVRRGRVTYKRSPLYREASPQSHQPGLGGGHGGRRGTACTRCTQGTKTDTGGATPGTPGAPRCPAPHVQPAMRLPPETDTSQYLCLFLNLYIYLKPSLCRMRDRGDSGSASQGN